MTLIFALDLHLVVRCLKYKFLWILLSCFIDSFKKEVRMDTENDLIELTLKTTETYV